MSQSSLANGVQLTSDSSPRNARIDRFIVHHAATTSLAAILSLFQPGGRTVSANYALGSDGTLVLAVDESRRAWTSGSAEWDGRAVTIEVANSYAGEPWPVSDAAFDKLARLIADVSIRYGFPINDDTILTHQELYRRYGASYATACPGDMQRRKGELLARANHYRANGGSINIPKGEQDVQYWKHQNTGQLVAVDNVSMTYRFLNKYEGMVVSNLVTAGLTQISTFGEPAWTETLGAFRAITEPDPIPGVSGIPVIDYEKLADALSGAIDIPTAVENGQAARDAIVK